MGKINDLHVTLESTIYLRFPTKTWFTRYSKTQPYVTNSSTQTAYPQACPHISTTLCKSYKSQVGTLTQIVDSRYMGPPYILNKKSLLIYDFQSED